ncbi:MAG: Rhs element Vgr protein [bacterium]|jgi:Rhs element Vgr protein
MADSPTLKGSGIVEVTVLSNGSELPETVQIRSVTVRKSFNKIPIAVIVIEDGNMPQQSFSNSDLSTFEPGAEIEIKVGYDQKTESLFKGVIIRQGIRISQQNDSRLVIECKDKAIKMTLARRNANYLKMKDSDIISKLISNNGLSADVGSTQTKYEELVQFNCTDWDFLMTRAEANGLLVNVNDGKVTVDKPDASSSAVLSVEYGTDLYEFEANLDAESQLSKVSSVAWDAAEQKIVKGTGKLPSLNAQGDVDQSKLAKVLGIDDYNLQSTIQLEKTALDDWASGQLLKSGLSRICGHMTIQGSAKAQVGKIIDLKGVGKRFSGSVYASSVVHRVSAGSWFSEVEFGLDSHWFHENYQVHSPKAGGFVGAADGLNIGIVKKIDSDPEGQFRVQLSLPILQAETDEIWARLASFYAPSGVGAYFMPEIGDEVIVGYFNNDPSNPVILGSMYSKKNAAPYTPDQKNTKKAIISKEKLTLEFDDENKVITVTTPGKNKIVLSDKDKSISLEDQNSNKVTLDSGGITLDSPKDIKISAKGKVSISATSNIELAATADLKADGMNVNLSAKTALSAKGNATAEFSASGQTTVKGAMVMIN